MDDLDLEHLLAIFTEEATEFTEQLSDGIESLSVRSGEELSTTLLYLMRVAHNIKGAALSVGMSEIVTIAHQMEDTFNNIYNAERVPTPDEAESLRAMASSLHQHLDAISGEPLDRSEADPNDASAVEEAAAREGRIRFRIESERLDHLISHTDQILGGHARLVAGQQKLLSFHVSLRAAAQGEPSAADIKALVASFESMMQSEASAVSELGQLIQTMGWALKRLRMLPLKQHANHWRRIVREAAHALGRDVALNIDVGDLELDKHITDNLRDPLMHLLRNAVGHGIEPSHVREAVGKPKRGTITIRANMQGAMVRIEVSDDGCGIDSKHICKRALATGLVDSTVVSTMDDREVLQLLFMDGFSTADTVDQVSGRGVGLSAVRSQVEQLGGFVEIAGHPTSGGTTFILTLPPSVLSVVGLLVRHGHSVFAVPLDFVSRSFHLNAERIDQAVGAPTYRMVDSEPIRIFGLNALLGFSDNENPNRCKYGLAIEHRGERIAVAIDDILGEHEFVIKPLPWNLGVMPGIHGATMLGDGTLAVSLDIPTMFELARGINPSRDGAPTDGEARSKRVLVVDDSMTSRTLERNMLVTAGFDVVTCVDGSEALRLLGAESFDLVVSDVQMPNVDGFELTRRLRADDRLRYLPIVLVTGITNADARARGLAAGANAYIVKDELDQRLLVEAVREQLIKV